MTCYANESANMCVHIAIRQHLQLHDSQHLYSNLHS